MIEKYLHNYLQESILYNHFFTESINRKADTIKGIDNHLEEIKKRESIFKEIKLGLNINNITKEGDVWEAFLELQKLKQESDVLPIIINGAIMTSFQLLEGLFFNIFQYFTGKDFMGGDIEKWLLQIEKDNNIFIGKDRLNKVIGEKILNSVLEYNKRRDLCTHSFGKITSKYIKFLNENEKIKKHIQEINKLGGNTFIQDFRPGKYIITSQEYYTINQTLLDFVACITCFYLVILKEGNINKFIKDISELLLTNKMYALTASVLISASAIKGFSLDIDAEINLLFACKMVNRGGFETKIEEICSKYRKGTKGMNKAQLFKWNLINNDVNEIINNIPKSEKELAKVMSNPITTFYFNDKFLIEKIKKSKVSAVLKKNVNSNHYKELSINGINNLKKILY